MTDLRGIVNVEFVTFGQPDKNDFVRSGVRTAAARTIDAKITTLTFNGIKLNGETKKIVLKFTFSQGVKNPQDIAEELMHKFVSNLRLDGFCVCLGKIQIAATDPDPALN